MSPLRSLTALVAASCLIAGVLSTTPASAAPPCVIYMDPLGSDANSGLTRSTPVRSLQRVHEVIWQLRPAVDVEVRINQGVYVAPPINWWVAYVPGHTISFMPIDYEYGEGGGGIAGMPIFRNKVNADGTYPDGYWIQAAVPSGEGEPLRGGGTSGLRFYYLQVERYSAGGVSMFGGEAFDYRYDPPVHRKPGPGLNGNTFFGMRFFRLGNRWTPGATAGYGAIVLTNSSNNRIENNHFDYIENLGDEASAIHGLYATHFSSSNSVTRNGFEHNSGEPVKIRDQSNYNTIEYNEFYRAGVGAYYLEQFCDLDCAQYYDMPRQCASFHNRFFHNTLWSGYDPDEDMATWTLDPPGLTYPGTAPCSIPAGEYRLRTGYNTGQPTG